MQPDAACDDGLAPHAIAQKQLWRNVVNELFALSTIARCLKRHSHRVHGQGDFTGGPFRGLIDRTAKGCLMLQAGAPIGATASQQNSSVDVIADSVEQRHTRKTAAATDPLTCTKSTAGPRRPASPVRLTLAPRLGNKIDGAWWPRTAMISRELTELVSVLDGRLGRIREIDVNWSSLQRQHDLNWDWWQGIRPHIMTVGGCDARATLLIVPHRTATALAVMVLRQSAGLPVYTAHRDSRAFQIAESIVRVARGEPMFEARGARGATR